MQKQAIPLTIPQTPLIRTGEESTITSNTYYNIITHSNSIVIDVNPTKIIIYETNYNKYKIYLLSKPNKSNQETCLRLRPIVNTSQILNPGNIIAECQSSSNGNISLGANLLVAFMCWNGFNYEDSVLISESVVSNGTLDSLHIMELKTKINKTQFGKEWLTNDLKMVPIKHYWYLPKDGIVKSGWVVRENDILVGKLSPKSLDKKFQINEEEENKKSKEVKNKDEKNKELEVIKEDEETVIDECKHEYDEDNVKDTSLRVPTGITLASVLEINKTYSPKRLELDGSYEEYIINLDIIIRKYIKKWSLVKFQINPYVNGPILLNNELKTLYKKYINDLKRLEQRLFEKFGSRLTANNNVCQYTLESISIKLLIRKSIQTGDKISGRHGNKGVISKIVPREDMPF
ncbi:MAG: hypothetical protein ACKESA_01270, partial [Candidatus Hodgkinia cicadicola]